MPISRYQIRNEYSLADPELYRAADKDDPEALLEGVAMAGLVGVLRQLGDLAEFAAEIFHDLHEEVMVTAARGHSLMARVQQLEAEFPSIERVFLSQTNHSSFLSNAGTDWHPNLRFEQNLVTCGDLPRFVMDSYEECRGPPRLFLLDKFDVAGAGACLKRYTDPSFFKMEAAFSGMARTEVHREKRTRKVKKKGTRWRNGETPEIAPAHTKLHQLLLEERIENAYTDPARLVKLKKRQLNSSAVESKTGKSYMEKLLETPSPDQKMVCETSIFPLPKKLLPDDTSEAGVRVLEISTVSPSERPLGHKSPCSSLTEPELEIKPSLDMDGETNGDLVKRHEQMPPGVTDEMSYNHFGLPRETEFAIDEKDKIEGDPDGYESDDVTSDVDNYLDALATIDSEVETDNEYKSSFLNVRKATDANGKEEHQRQFESSDCQSSGEDSASDENISSKRDKNEELTEKQVHFSDCGSIGTSPASNENSSFKRERNEEPKEMQSQFSDSHSIGASSESDESSSLKKDRNEEHMELHAQFSDSQSIGNSSMSNENSSFKNDRSCFSHSDSLGPAVENIESDGYKALELLSPTKCCASEIEDNQFNLVPQIVLSQKTDGGDTHIEEEEVPESGQASSVTSEHMSWHSDYRATSSAALSAWTQFDEKLPVSVEYQSDEDRKYPVDYIASVPNSPSLMKVDVFPMVSPEKNLVNEVDNGDSYLDSCDLSQVSIALASAPEDRHDYLSEINVLPTGSQNNSLGKHPNCPSMPSDLSPDTMLLPDNLDLKSEAVLKVTQLGMEGLSPVVETSPTSGFEVGKFSDLACKSSQEEPDSAGVEVLYYDQQAHVKEISRMVHHDEINESNYSVDAVEDNGHHDYPSSLDSEGLMNHLMKNDLMTEKVEPENGAVSDVPSFDRDDANVGRWTDSGQESSCLGSSNSHQTEMESNGVKLTEAFAELEAGKRENQLETYSDIASSNSTMGNLCNAQESNSTSSSMHDTEKEMEVSEVAAKESLTAFETQLVVDQHEIVSNGSIPSLIRNSTNFEELIPTFMHPNEKDAEVNEAGASKSSTDLEAPKLVEQLEVTSADLQSSLDRSVSCEPADLETCNDIEDLASKEQTQNSIVNDELMVPKISVMDIEESESKSICHIGVLQEGKDDTSSTSCNHLESEPPLEQFLQSSVDQEDEESELRNVENPISDRLQSKLIQISDHSEQERSSCAAFDSALDINLDHAPPTGQQLNPSHVMDPLSTLLPDHLSNAADMNPEEMPPMPPLPPMQWRMGKVQHTSASHTELNDVSGPSFPTIQPIKTGETAQFSFLGSERQTWQYQNPFLPVLAVEGEKLQLASGFSVGFPGHPVTIPFQFPVVFNESNSPYNYLYLDRSSQCLQSPFVTLPMVSSGMPLNREHTASDRDVTDYTNSSPPVPPVENAFEHDSLQGKMAQPSNQIMADTSLEVEAHDKSSDNPEGGHGNPAISSKSLPSMESALSHINMLPPDGEMALSSDSSALTSDFEGERPNGKLHSKLPRPRNPLIDAVAAHDKSKLRKVTERDRPQLPQKEDERDSLLEQIRSKSFNLKPATMTRPSTHVPKTNLKVAAILEKANAIRQALAGSDEDDDADGWSDS